MEVRPGALLELEPLKLSLDAPVAFTGSGFQACSIQYLNPSVRVLNQAQPLQLGGNRVHRRPPCTEHDGHELLRENKFITIHTIVNHQQPAGAPLIDRMKRVARDALHQTRMVSDTERPANRLLRLLEPDAFRRLAPKLTATVLHSKQVLYKPNEPIHTVYFPENSVICQMTVMSN